MAQISVKKEVVIPKEEYRRLKELDKRFGVFLAYLENFISVKEARREIKQKRIIPQEKLFKHLGF